MTQSRNAGTIDCGPEAQGMEFLGTIVHLEGTIATVVINDSGACSACSIKGGCSAGRAKRQITVQAHPNMTLGQDVTVVLGRHRDLQAAVLLFILPVGIMTISASLGMALGLGEVIASLTGLGLCGLYYGVLGITERFIKTKFAYSIKSPGSPLGN